MEINSEGIDSMFRGFDVRFQTAYDATINGNTLWWNQIATEMASDADTQVHAWMADTPRMEKWLGEQTFSAISTHDYSLKNDDWHRSIKISRNRVKDDKYGIYAPMIGRLGAAAAKLPDEVLYQMLKDASRSMICYDGQDYFDDSHPIDMYRPELGVQSNVFTGRPLTYDNVWYVAQQMALFKSESDRPLDIMPNLLVVPSTLRQQALTIARAAMIAPQTLAGATQVGGQSNILVGEIEVLVIPELASISTTDWYLFDTKKDIKPFIYQVREAPKTIAQVDDAVRCLFANREYEWKVFGRVAGGVTLWQLGAKASA